MLQEIVSGEPPNRAALPEVLLLSSVGGRIVPVDQPPGRNSVPVYPDDILPSAASSRSGNTEHLKCLSTGIDGLLTPHMSWLPRAEPRLRASAGATCQVGSLAALAIAERERIPVLNRRWWAIPRAKKLRQRQRQNDKRDNNFCPSPSQWPPGTRERYAYAVAGASQLSRLDLVHEVVTTGPS